MALEIGVERYHSRGRRRTSSRELGNPLEEVWQACHRRGRGPGVGDGRRGRLARIRPQPAHGGRRQVRRGDRRGREHEGAGRGRRHAGRLHPRTRRAVTPRWPACAKPSCAPMPASARRRSGFTTGWPPTAGSSPCSATWRRSIRCACRWTVAIRSTLNAGCRPLAADGNPWRYTARELQAVCRPEQWRQRAAREIFTRLADDMETPGQPAHARNGNAARHGPFLTGMLHMTFLRHIRPAAGLTASLLLVAGCALVRRGRGPAAARRAYFRVWSMTATCSPTRSSPDSRYRLARRSATAPGRRPVAGRCMRSAMPPARRPIGRAAWNVDIGSSAGSRRPLLSGPVIAGGRVFTMDSKFRVSAYGVDKGKRLWRVEREPVKRDWEAFGGGLAFAGGKLFVSTGYGRVAALNPEDGAVHLGTRPAGPRARRTPGHGRHGLRGHRGQSALRPRRRKRRA